ncbi:transposase InsO family protein [Leucobacter exalbidus]|uniref:Transposase InsO family protein n=1 Tax=Leucobacter exalbidus TaxID=662960 RepID=A0A940T4G4_9MICO|nr:transposase InsO family protein [Leucobacter exalbidus]
MHRNPLLILAITVQGLSYRDAAFAPQSRAPHTSPHQTAPEIRDRILALRESLTVEGSDAGADTICAYLAREDIVVSRTTVWRVLQRAHHITPQPQKRPRSSWKRFEASQPNEMWQSDFTHWQLTSGQEVEIVGWLDDHARFLTHLTVHHRVTGKIVVETFTTAAQTHGFPASTLTDNGMVYTARLARGGRQAGLNAFETLLRIEGITQKNGRPYKPTTQGKIERFWQTLKKYLAQHPADTIADLQNVLDQFREFYNEQRPHRALGRKTPAFAYALIPKASPAKPSSPALWQVRYDIVDANGSITLRYAGKLRHLGIGRGYARTEVICLVNGDHATVITHTGEVLGEYTIDTQKNYQKKNT